MNNYATNIKDACPDHNKDMREFSETIEKARKCGAKGVITMHASSGSWLLYHMESNTPVLYQPYIKAIFNSVID